jgi:hypothetical protein
MSYLKQLDLILGVCGTPLEEDLKGTEKAVSYVKKLRK